MLINKCHTEYVATIISKIDNESRNICPFNAVKMEVMVITA